MKWSKISNYKIKKILKCFSEDLTATQTANLLGINRNTVNRYYVIFRKKIAFYLEYINSGIELNKGVKIKKQFEKTKKAISELTFNGSLVFGIFKTKDRICTEIIKSINSFEFKKNIRSFISDKNPADYEFLKKYESVIVEGIKHYRLKNLKRRKGNIDSVGSFLGYVKRRLSKFNGIPKRAFYLHLKESEFRYNEKNMIYEKMLLIFKKF